MLNLNLKIGVNYFHRKPMKFHVVNHRIYSKKALDRTVVYMTIHKLKINSLKQTTVQSNEFNDRTIAIEQRNGKN